MPTSPTSLDSVFHALADGTRRAILRHLAQCDASVTELAEPFDMSQPAVTKHLKVLETAGLVTRSRKGRVRPAHLAPDACIPATDYLAEVRTMWEARYAALDDVLHDLQSTPNEV